ncbi:leucine zipper protein 2-like isoform X1 [Oncorhynchus kisutch]|uniref:leucine zipper protein 2-like isoform X1 n=1 Tax=Oncorhynchus kisutch TaxID=8019 RepID=UPI0012DCA6EA|nr:leucine zipper protein 2-like isoform X1 [Oncorhynchus kisutch]
MKLIRAICLLLLCPALSLNTRQGYEGLEQKLKEVFTERTGILRQLSKTTKELDSIKGNLQTLKNDDSVTKKDVQRILELSHKQREEMKSLQTALQKQLDEATEEAEKQQATIKFLKMEMEKKTKTIKDLQQENKSLKNKLLSGNKLCDVHAEESKKIQAQLKELRYGKKDLIFKGQQLMDLEHKLTIAKEELEKAALDKESQLKALKDTVHICFSAVLHNQHTSSHRFPATPTHLFRYSSLVNSSRVTFQQPHAKDIPKVQRIIMASKSPANIGVMRRESNPGVKDCQMEKIGGDCFQNQTETESSPDSKKLLEQQSAALDVMFTPDQALIIQVLKRGSGGEREQRTAAQIGKSNAKPSDDREDVEGGSKNTKLHKNN